MVMSDDFFLSDCGGGQPPFSVAIVGAGPSGLYAASLCGMLGLRVAVFETAPFVGGQCSALYPQKEVKGVPGFSGATAQELVACLERQAQKSGTTFFLEACVKNLREIVRPEGTLFELTVRGQTFYARSVLIATGMGRFRPNKPTFPATGTDVLEMLEGRSVHYFVSDPVRFHDQRVVVAGGGDSAVDWVLGLLSVARSITLVHRREVFRCVPDSMLRLQSLENEGRLTIYRSAQLKGLKTEGDHLTHVILEKGAEECVVEADHLLVFFGLAADLGCLSSWELAPRLFIRTKVPVDPLSCATAVPGVFAIGDIVAYPSNAPAKVTLIAAGFGEAVTAAYAIKRTLYPDEKLPLNVQSLQH